MSIVIKKRHDGYIATVTPPDIPSGEWSTVSALPLRWLIAKLEELGCHQREIGDALYQANPDWLRELENSTLPRKVPDEMSRSISVRRRSLSVGDQKAAKPRKETDRETLWHRRTRED